MLRIGAGAGFAGDRIDPAIALVERTTLDYLVFECLAERTIALAQRQRLSAPDLGYDPLLERRMAAVLPAAKAKRTRILTNMGAANPLGAARAVINVAKRLDLAVNVAAVTGDDVLDQLDPNATVMETGQKVSTVANIVSANAYIGADALLPALEAGADVIVAGRVADPSLFLAPMVAHYKWRREDVDLIARGTVIGHLLECAGQITGGYFADPGVKDVPDMANLGFPFAEIEADGSACIGKAPGTGGRLTLLTCKEQLLYEVHDPSAYLTPDSAANFTAVELAEAGPDRIAVSGATGAPAPTTLKVSIGYHAGFIGEGEISYAGPHALARARMAGDIVKTRLSGTLDEIRVDLIGFDSVHRRFYGNAPEPYEIRLRVAGRAADRASAERVGEEVEALYTNGPAGGGGARKYTREVIGVVSTLMPRERVKTETTYFSHQP